MCLNHCNHIFITGIKSKLLVDSMVDFKHIKNLDESPAFSSKDRYSARNTPNTEYRIDE